MKLLKKILLMLSIVFLISNLNASEQIAKNFLHYKGIDKNITSSLELKKDDAVVGYLYNLEDNGYIIIPLSKSLSPIKSYSFESNYVDLPKEYQEFLLQELYNFASYRGLLRVIDNKVNERWNFIENYDSSKRVLYRYIAGENLLETSWNQKYPYNKHLPKINGSSVPAGCVQIAIGQLMKYHGYPSRGSGVVKSTQATNNVQDMTAVLNRYYNWDNIANNTTGIKEYQEDEVGYLIRDLVVMNQASMSTSGTGASIDKNLYIKNFGYSNTWDSMNLSGGSDTFYTKLKEQIDAELPVILSLDIVGSIGHMVVADGYQETQTGTEIHINMGWGSSYNVFYNLDTNFQAATYTFDTTDISMQYNIKPCSDSSGDCYEENTLETNDLQSASGFELSGTFDVDGDQDIYEVYLSGNTTFSGASSTSQYAPGQYFYIQVNDTDGNEIIISQNQFTENLNPGKYQIVLSEYFSHVGGYPHIDGHNYTVNITTTELNQSQKDAADIASMTPPAIDQDLETKVVTGDEATKVYINGYASNPNDTLSFKAIANNGNVQLCTNNNILTITPTVTSGHSKIKVIMTAGTSTVEKEFDLYLSDKTYLTKREYSLIDSFNSQNDTNSHEIYLEGECSILGYVDYGDIRYFGTFYTKIIDSSAQTVLDYTKPYTGSGPFSGLSGNYSVGIYTLTTSLQNLAYDQNFSKYIIDISCPNVSTDTNSVGAQTGISIDSSAFGSNHQNFCSSANVAPSITGNPVTTITAGTQYSFTPTSTDADNGDTLSFSITNKPTWATFNEFTGELTGTPDISDVGVISNIVISVTDSFNTTVSLPSFNIEVTSIVTNTAPTITGTPPTSVIEGFVYSFSPIGGDIDNGDTLTYSITNKPSWADFNTSTGTLSGTPTSSHIGITDNIVISISDGTDSASLDPFSILVNENTQDNSNSDNNIVDQNFTIALQTGWNLVSLPVDLNISYNELNSVFESADTLWTYNNGWKAYGKGTLQNLLDDASISRIDSLRKGEGFWINSSATDTLEFSGSSYDSVTPTTSGWHLLGAGKDFNVTDIETSNSNLHTVWVYDNGWQAYGTGSMAQAISDAGFFSFSTIERGQGYWINNQ